MRDILLRIESRDSQDNSPICLLTFKDLCDDLPKLSLQIELLADAGFIEIVSELRINNNTKDFVISRITFDGYDYLDSVRSDSVWASVKQKLADIGDGASIEVVKSLATSLVMKQLGI